MTFDSVCSTYVEILENLGKNNAYIYSDSQYFEKLPNFMSEFAVFVWNWKFKFLSEEKDLNGLQIMEYEHYQQGI